MIKRITTSGQLEITVKLQHGGSLRTAHAREAAAGRAHGGGLARCCVPPQCACWRKARPSALCSSSSSSTQTTTTTGQSGSRCAHPPLRGPAATVRPPPAPPRAASVPRGGCAHSSSRCRSCGRGRGTDARVLASQSRGRAEREGPRAGSRSASDVGPQVFNGESACSTETGYAPS